MLSARAVRLRRAANWLNGSTLAGRLAARFAADGTHSWTPASPATREFAQSQGLNLVSGYRPRFPNAGALTLGDVVLFSARVDPDAVTAHYPGLLAHEAHHCTQYAWCTGPGLWLLYPLACAWSLARTGNPFAANAFERGAGLADAGYLTADELPAPTWLAFPAALRRRLSARRRRSRATSSGASWAAAG